MHSMVLMVLFVVLMALWGLTALPFPQAEPLARGRNVFAFCAVLCLGLYIFMPGLR